MRLTPEPPSGSIPVIRTVIRSLLSALMPKLQVRVAGWDVAEELDERRDGDHGAFVGVLLAAAPDVAGAAAGEPFFDSRRQDGVLGRMTAIMAVLRRPG